MAFLQKAVDLVERNRTYEYKSSLTGENGPWIRLLELQPGKRENRKVHVALQDYKFDDTLPKYDALSYAWGINLEPQTIFVDGRKFEVGVVLWEALWWFSRAEGYQKQLFWIDRICSNQHDEKEKSQQVSLMRDIFERSRQTIAWLGGPEKEDNQRIAAGITKLNSMTFTLLDSLLERHTGRQDADSSRGQTSSKSQQSKIDSTASRGISQLLKKGWFRRVWVVQEVAVSKTVIVQCRDARIDFDVLVAGVMQYTRELERNPNEIHEDPVNAANLFQHTELSLMSDLRHCGPDTKGLELADLLAATHRAGAADIRDKLFSLYGITSTNLGDLRLRPDYTTSKRQILIDATFSLLKTRDNLDLLEVAEGHDPKDTSFPSWVPASNGPALHGQRFLGHSPKTQDALLRAAVDAVIQADTEKWKGITDEQLEDIVDDFKDASVEHRLSSVQMPQLPSSKITKLELDESGVLYVHGQLVDKIQEVQPTRVGPVSTMFNRDASPISLTTFEGTRDFARVVIDRDKMVMKRSKTHDYPNGDSVLTAYRKAVCTGQEVGDDLEEAERAFDTLRSWLTGAKWTTWLERKFHIDVSFGIGTTMALVMGMVTMDSEAAQRMWQLMAGNAFSRVLAWTEKGYLAIVPADTKVGDTVALLNGGRMPFVLRTKRTGSAMLGPAYVHGIMGGELSNTSPTVTVRFA